MGNFVRNIATSLAHAFSANIPAITNVSVKNRAATSGDMYATSQDDTLNAAAAKDWVLEVGAVPIHLNSARFISGDAVTVKLYEAPVYSAGSVVTPNNTHRQSSKVSSVVLKEDCTVTDVGTILIYEAAYNPGTGGLDTNEILWTLAPNTDYLIRCTNNGAGQEVVTSALGWVEALFMSEMETPE